MKVYEAVFLSKISPKQDFNRNRAYFFYFVTWISLIIWSLLVVFTNIFGKKILSAERRPEGPADRPKSFKFFC